MKKPILLFALLLGVVFPACAGQDDGKATTITPQALQDRLKSGEKPLIVDVREPSEFKAGHIADARLAPLASVEEQLKDTGKDREIILVCRSGRRSGLAQKTLAARGYTSLTNMEGGMLAWEKLGYPVVKP